MPPTLKFNAPKQEVNSQLFRSKNDLFKIIRPIGKGGSSTVYSARSQKLEKNVAIKVFNPDTDDLKARKACVDELLASQNIQHPNIARTLDAGFDYLNKFIVMELIEGLELEPFIEQNRFDEVNFLNFAIQTLEALAHIHSQQIIHLDIKPINIMVSQESGNQLQYRIIDFGSAKVLSNQIYDHTVGTRGLAGSVHFMSPELINNEIPDERADIYALGCTFYNVLTQKRPFEGESAIQVIAAHIQGLHTPLKELCNTVSPSIIALVEKMISCKREDRPRSAESILQAIKII